MIIKTTTTIAFLLLLLSIPQLAISANLDWLFDCSYRGKDFNYFKEIEKLKNDTLSRKAITSEMNRQLPKAILGENFVCIYEPILYFGDDSTIRHFENRARKPQMYADRTGYASDILTLLKSRSSKYDSKNDFMKMISSFKRPTSIEYFLTMHLQELPFRLRMDVMIFIVNNRKLPGHHNYATPVIMQKLYNEDPKAYDAYLKEFSNIPDEFTCFKDETCP